MAIDKAAGGNNTASGSRSVVSWQCNNLFKSPYLIKPI
jgi:hypothetical protein